LASQLESTFLGGVPDVIPYYHAADLFALASNARSETVGIVQIEAMAAGLPVVNTNLDTGVPLVSSHDQTGFTVAPNDPIALGEAIGSLLNDPELRRAFGHAARIRAQQEFRLDLMVRRTLSLYKGVLARRDPED
jgi:rhamnosyl/mannosyltransferase